MSIEEIINVDNIHINHINFGLNNYKHKLHFKCTLCHKLNHNVTLSQQDARITPCHKFCRYCGKKYNIFISGFSIDLGL
jgi:hypothetical protein